MPSFRVRWSDSTKSSDVLAEIPEGFRGDVKRGFSLLVALRPEHYQLTLDSVVEMLTLGEPQIDETQIASVLGLSRVDASIALAAGALIVIALSGTDVSENVVATMQKGGVVDAEHIAGLQNLVRFIESKRPSWSPALKGRELERAVIPSIRVVNSTVDVRIGFDEDKIELTIPVAIVYINTDAPDSRLWFQATERELERLIQDLQKTLKRVKTARDWIAVPRQ